MVFNSLHFVWFFVIVYALYRVLPHRAQNWLLLAASYYFYAAWDWRFLGLLIASTLVDYTCALALDRSESPRRRRALLCLSLGFNLTLLGFFKYFNFFAVFVAYFPHLVAGPILRASRLLPQIQLPRTVAHEQIRDGLWLIAWGFFQKIFVADNLASVANMVFDPAAHPTGVNVLLGTYAFALQIYGDFAGYSNIARGTSKLMGIELMENFRFPYLVRSPQEFWRHWHISLSTWLRDYLYIPLGGNRGSGWQTD